VCKREGEAKKESEYRESQRKGGYIVGRGICMRESGEIV
jgi:hypothetical protein